jgi:ABC-type antimicrobial peptide transport system permease subunit
MVMAIAVAAIVGVVAGLGPAVQAASVEPTMALRYE